MLRGAILLLFLTTACQAGNPRSGSSTPAGDTEASEAEAVVQRQYEAYNRRDLNGFVATHDSNVRVYRYPDSLVIEGREALRERFGKLFANAPQLHANVDARMAHGNVVIWKETATGMPGGKSSTAISVWEIRDGLISRILFIP